MAEHGQIPYLSQWTLLPIQSLEWSEVLLALGVAMIVEVAAVAPLLEYHDLLGQSWAAVTRWP